MQGVPQCRAQQFLERSPVPEVRIVIDEFAFRRPAALAQTWDDQLLRIEAVAMWRHVALKVLPFAAGAHHHMSGTLALLWQKDGTAVAYKGATGAAS
ncbi:Scr1 family TA system antitoxin-like transcriptional regulator [Streptomyces sp. NPDC048527]|uniref:Scr1 family TA system antitoxin-like transcriptional regulator n=1 Tax=Streptomyces sp. NPDC048527 TaxID=3365568 RepID=UPI00371041D8